MKIIINLMIKYKHIYLKKGILKNKKNLKI